jgi:hypothetical protein
VPPLLHCKSEKCYIFRECVCSLKYPACNAHAPFCDLWPARLYHIFPHYLIKGITFGQKKWWVIKYVLICFTTVVWNISHSERNWVRCNHKRTCIHVFVCSSRYFCQILTKVDFFIHFRKLFKYQISWKSDELEPSSSMRTDRHTDKTKIVAAFRNFANVPKKLLIKAQNMNMWR